MSAKAGTLNLFLLFEVLTTTRDGFGSAVETWTPDFEERGSFEMAGSREFPAAEKRFAEATGRFRIRYREGVDAALYRIRMKFSDADVDHVWNVYPPQPDMRTRDLLIEASEIL